MYIIQYECRTIQNYIYSTSKIKEIMGASLLVRNILKEVFKEACYNLGYKIPEDDNARYMSSNPNGYDACIGYEGGGNITCFFWGEEEQVKKLNQEVGFLFLKKTYSLRVCYAYVERTNSQKADDYINDKKKLSQKISEAKTIMTQTNLFPALPIVMISQENSLPLSSKKNENGSIRKITAESKLKLDAYESYQFDEGERNFDNMCEKNEDSYLAVVHIDVNDLGTGIANSFSNAREKRGRSYDDYVQKSRDISKDIKEKFNDEFDNVIKDYFGGDKSNYRIIINSGDDITFVVKNIYAIDLVTRFLAKIHKESFSFQTNSKISACAGIAFVKSHFPFDKAYQIAEELCESAKKKAKQTQPSNCAFDYYICQNGFITSVEEDERKFSSLYSKPYYVGRNQHEYDDYEEFLERCKELSRLNSLGKIKQIRNAYEVSNEEINMVMKRISSRLDKMTLEAKDGSGHAKYYDASCLYDFMELKEEKEHDE